MRILVTGRHGQVVRSLVERASAHPQFELITLGRPELDLADTESVSSAIHTTKPDLVISAAAYTAVDQAEDEPEYARAINARGVGSVAKAAADLGVPVIHLSTDYVFSGESDGAYSEDDSTGPRTVYGQTKLEGEIALAAANPRHLILRTAWVYSPFGKNFIKTILHLGETRDHLSVVSDQWGNPTSAIDIADAILHVAGRLGADSGFSKYGIYHLAGTGHTNWSGFARAIFARAEALGRRHVDVADITTAQYPTKALRPLNSRLNTEKFSRDFGWNAPEWQQSMSKVVIRLLQESENR
ncbi:dTDP-4-dehydrorhamnose reductase [Phyllobacterium sp. YR531]|uniref:dTDP-4-dehydrorhamnose reductase n=1 Tax=Phyllobacterium sp. YR531 TaxID=1144343 RepID=UPI00026F986D|nr:dTDP-4-dehydrorhamnose reductase [Phyllobacterium sp. YR531]EJN05339.1 dTDP-4-dehydrorhamnose reductase [Phyllobacterium sp. YR531]